MAPEASTEVFDQRLGTETPYLCTKSVVRSVWVSQRPGPMRGHGQDLCRCLLQGRRHQGLLSRVSIEMQGVFLCGCKERAFLGAAQLGGH